MAHLPKQLRIMKWLITLAALLLCSLAYGQELLIDDTSRDVIWFNVYQSELTQDDVLEHLLTYAPVKNVVTHRDMIVCDLIPTKLDYEGAGYNKMHVSMYLLDGKFGGRLILRFKEGRYKAEVIHTYFTDSEGPMYGTTSAFDYSGSTHFDVTAYLIMQYLTRLLDFKPIDNEW